MDWLLLYKFFKNDLKIQSVQYHAQIFAFVLVGSRNTLVNMEARRLDSTVVTRRCIVTRLAELDLARYQSLIDNNAGAILILLPIDLGQLSDELQQVSCCYQVPRSACLTTIQRWWSHINAGVTKRSFF